MSRTFLIAIVSLLVMQGPFTSNIVIPSLYEMSLVLGESFGETQLLLSAYMAGFAVGQIYVGVLSDYWGRRPILLISLAVSTLASLAGALCTELTPLILARLVQGLGLSATLSVGRAIVRDAFPAGQMVQVFAYAGTALALGPILGPVVGGFVHVTAGWQGVFWCMSGLGALMICLIALGLRETNPQPNRRAIEMRLLLDDYRTLLSSRRYIGYVMCNAYAYGGIFIFASCSSDILIGRLHVAPDVFGALFALTIGAYGLGTLAASQITPRVGMDRMIVLGGLIMTLGGMFLTVFPSIGLFDVWTIILPFAVFAFGTGFVFPSGQTGAISPFPDRAGAASSLLSLLQMTFAAIAGALAARTLDSGVLTIGAMVLFMGIAMLLTFHVLVQRPVSANKG